MLKRNKKIKDKISFKKQQRWVCIELKSVLGLLERLTLRVELPMYKPQ